MTGMLRHWPETPQGWVKEKMTDVSQIWVTPDSVSMVYEAITSGVPTGVFNMRPKKKGRIVKGILKLIEEGWVSEFTLDTPSTPPATSPAPLWESERTAIWLLERYNEVDNHTTIRDAK